MIMRNPYQRKATSNQNSNFSAKDIYKQFVETITAQTKIYALYKDGWALCATPSGQQTLAIWQSKGLAQLLIKDNWVGYKVEEIPLVAFIDHMIPYIRQNNTHLSLNLTPEGQNVLVSGDVFLLDLKKYLYQLYTTQPELFKNAELPSPRKIRIHQKSE